MKNSSNLVLSKMDKSNLMQNLAIEFFYCKIANKISVFFLFTILTLLPILTNAQRIRIGGIITEDENIKLTNSTVSLIHNDVLVEQKKTDASGRFAFNLKPALEYYIIASKTGYVTKKLYVSTTGIPENVDIIWTSGISIDLFREVKNLDVSIFDNPVGKIFYYEEFKNLSYDIIYTKTISAKLEELHASLVKYKETEKAQKKEELLEQNKNKVNQAKEQRKAQEAERKALLKSVAEDKRKLAENKIANKEKAPAISNAKNIVNEPINDSIRKQKEEFAKANFNRKLSKEERDKYLADLALNSPKGTSVEIESFQSFTITRIINNNNNIADEYRMIEFNFGNFYKKNFIDITEEVFKAETKGYEQYIKK